MTKQHLKLTDSQWAAISSFFNLKRKRSVNLRSVVDALLYMVRTGCQWRNLPSEYPHWRATNYYFERWKKDGRLQAINVELNKQDRKREQKRKNPSLMCIDSQSVKLSPMIFEHRGIDNHKKINGRKRQLMVDSGGRIWHVKVHAANENDGRAAAALLKLPTVLGKRLKKIVGDNAYLGAFSDEVRRKGLIFEQGQKPESTKGFVPIAKRWVVERTIAWTNFFRRIIKDYEYTIQSSVAWVLLANITIMLQRIQV